MWVFSFSHFSSHQLEYGNNGGKLTSTDLKNLSDPILNDFQIQTDKIELLNSLGVKVSIDESVYDKLATIAIKKETGARGLIGAVDKLFVKAMNEISQNENIYETLSIDEKTIDNPKEYTLTKKKSNK